MIKKIIALLLIIAIVGGGTWFLLSNAPSKSVERLRKKIDTLLKSNDSAEWDKVTTATERSGKDLNDVKVRADIAREASDKILEIYPNSEYDLTTRGAIEEISGDSKEALRWYDKIASLRNPPAINELRRAAILKQMGSIRAAKGAVAGILDVYPFEANFELGQLHLETFQPLEAYRAFSRAKDHVNNDDELRRILEGNADALDQLILLTRNQLERLKKRNAEENHIKRANSTLRNLEVERDKNLDKAIELLEKVEPGSRSQFVGIQIKIFSLINRKNDPNRLKTARETLIQSVSSDEDLRYFPIYLLLGSVDLQLGYSDSITEHERSEYIHHAIDNFNKVFSFDFEGKTAKVADIAEWNLSEHLTQDEFEARVLLRICQNLLKYPEFWRIIGSEDANGARDVLDIYTKLQSALKTQQENTSTLQEIKTIQALASLKNDDLDTYTKLITALLTDIAEPERPELALKITQGIVSFVPRHIDSMVELLNKEIFEKTRALGDEDDRNLARLKTAITILNQARYRLYINRAQLSVEAEGESEKITTLIDGLTTRIHDAVSDIAKMSTTPLHFLFASQLMTSFVGPADALDTLEQGRVQFPDDFQIRSALGRLHLNLARNNPGQDMWPHLHNAAEEFLYIYAKQPHDTEVLQNLLSIGSQYRINPNATPNLDLTATISEIFPNSSEPDANVLATVLAEFLQQDFKKAVENLPDANSASGIRPFLNLIAGFCYLEQASIAVKQRLADNPLLSGGNVSHGDSDKFSQLYANARKEFEAGLALNDKYTPLRLELIKMDLNAIRPGQEISEELLKQLKDLRRQSPEIPQIHYLLGAALKKKREFMIKADTKLSEMSKVLSKERTALRRAIKANPLYTEAYVALAETYVIPWRLTKGVLGEYKNSYNKLGTPEFNVAISVLRGAPSSPQVVKLIAQYFEAQKVPEKALEYYKALVQLEPVMANFSRVVQAYIDTGDFKGARDWLQSINSRSSRGDFSLTRDTLLAYVSSVEASTPAISDHQKNLLEESQIEQYRSIIDQSKKLGRAPPMLVINNLAYLLANRGMAEEALGLIEPLVEKLRKSKDSLAVRAFQDIEDTYAWSLYKAGKPEAAIKVYERLCSEETRLDIHLNYARCLFDLNKNQEALEQVRLILNSDREEKRTIEAETRELQDEIELTLKQ